jgi:hypothetical protein
MRALYRGKSAGGHAPPVKRIAMLTLFTFGCARFACLVEGGQRRRGSLDAAAVAKLLDEALAGQSWATRRTR